MPESPPTPTLAGNREVLLLLVVGSLGGVVSALAVTMAGSLGLAVLIVCIGLTIAVGLALVRPAALLLTFVVLLPFHFPAMLLMFNVGIGHDSIRAFSVWKEVAALGLLAVLLVRQVGSGKLPRTRVLDGIILAFFLLNFLYLIFPVMSPREVALAARAQGFRDNTFFVILYFIGRLAPLAVSEVRLVAATAIGVGAFGVAVGLVERVLLPIQIFFDPLHLDDFMRDYVNLHFFTGIPFNFWTSTGTVRRSVSFYLSSQHFATASVLLFPLVLVLRRPLRPFPAALRMPLLALFAVGLALPLTRSVMLACFLQIVLIGWATRRPHYVLSGVLSVALMVTAASALFDVSGYVRSVVSTPEGSLLSHVSSWRDATGIVQAYPFGVGFGIFDSVAERAATGGAGVLAGEGEYAFTAVALGVPGLLLFLALQGGTAWMLFHTWRGGDSASVRQLALFVLAVFLGYVIVGMFTQVRHIPAVLFPLWWLVGAVARGELEGDRPEPSSA